MPRLIPRPSSGPPLFLGVIHLPALPGSPLAELPIADVVRRATHDAVALLDGGVDGIIVENFGDAPFARDGADAVTVAALTHVALAVRRAAPDVMLGVNVLRNDARSALAIAAAVDAEFIRVNVHVGAMVTDQGVIEGRARDTLLLRRQLGARVAIAADVLVKHAVPLGDQRLDDVGRDTWDRGLADALIVTGSGTGRPTDPADVDRLRAACPDAPIWIGSGLDPARASFLAGRAHGAIVGTWLHEGGDVRRPIDSARVRDMAGALRR